MSLDDPRIQTAKKLHADKSMAVSAICQTLQISRPTLYRWLSTKPQPTSAS
jgi:predicted DNA-binding transcriptional regulator AlpA